MAKKPEKKPGKRPPDLKRIENDIDRLLREDAETPGPDIRAAAGQEPPAPLPSSSPDPSTDLPPQPGRPSDAAARQPSTQPQHPELILALSDDGLQASIRTVYPETTSGEILDILRRQNVTFGISEEAIRKALEAVRRTGQPLHDAIVARGIPSSPPAPDRIEYCLPPGLSAPPALAPICDLLKAQNRDEIQPPPGFPGAWLVRPGDYLAVQIVDSGEPGTGVQGESIPPVPREENAQNAPLEPGDGVKPAPNSADYLAGMYGYAGFLDGRVSVVAPIWISPDGMEACHLALSPLFGSGSPSADDIHASLSAAGVSTGIDDAAIVSLCEALEDGNPCDILFPLAGGRPPASPPVPSPIFSFPHRSRVGAIRPDGSIDFKERNLFPSVKTDALLVECQPPDPGTPGQTVRGEEIPPTVQVAIELTPGENVRLIEEDDGTRRLYAENDGGACVQISEIPTAAGMLRRYTVSVRSILQVSGDVNYETGNIDFRGNVEIRGSVGSGFRVVATGDVAVSGAVEAGAEVRSGGNVTVRQGIFGEETRVRASGALTARFIQDARVEADGDVVIGSYIHSAFVQTRGKVHVEGRGGANAGIIGGETWAMQGIASRNVGSERSTSTYLAVAIAPDLHAQYERAARTARQAGALLRNLLGAIGLPALKSEEVRKLIARKPAQKGAIIHYVRKANQLAQAREARLQEQQAIRASIAQAVRTAALDIPGTAHARVKVQIGDEQIQLQDDLKRVRFFAVPEGGRATIRSTDLSP